MAKVVRPIVGAVAKTGKQIYAIINGVHRKVKKIYVIVNGVTRSTWVNAKGVLLTGSVNGAIVVSNLESASTTTTLMEPQSSTSNKVNTISLCNNQIFIARSTGLYRYNNNNTLTQLYKASGMYSAATPQRMVYNDIGGNYFLTEFYSDNSPRSSCYYTTNLSTWTKLFSTQHIDDVCCGDKYLFASIRENYGQSDTAIVRYNTTNFTADYAKSPTFFDDAIQHLVYFNGYIVGYQGGDARRICYCNATSDLSTWQYVYIGNYLSTTYAVQSMRVLNGRIIICDYDRIVVSTNITNWSITAQAGTVFPSYVSDINYYEGKYYIVSSSGKIISSTNLTNWTTLVETSGHSNSKALIFPVSI